MRIPPPVTAKPDGPDLDPFPASEAAGEVEDGRASLRPLLALKPYVLRYRGMIAAALASSSPPLPGFLNALSGPLQHYGLWAIGLLITLEDFGIPVPGETIRSISRPMPASA